MDEQINLGKWSQDELDSFIAKAFSLPTQGERISFISKKFLNIEYKDATLVGSGAEPEVFIVNLEHLDCFTFLDYVEAMLRSRSYNEFRDNLKMIRYRDGDVQYEKRNHFFINWRDNNSDYIADVTAHAGLSLDVMKRLNDRGHGQEYLQGIDCSTVTVTYIPSASVDEKVISYLNTGDYIGIYTDKPGLDVTHVGIFIREGAMTFFRHASQIHKKVVDEDFMEYMRNKPGIIVFRSKK